MDFSNINNNLYYKIFYFLTGIILVTLINIIFTGCIGSTIGKWIFGIKILDKDLKPIGIRLAFKREMLVLVRGLGLYIPIITIFTMIAGYRILERDKITSWDKELRLNVLYHDVGFLRFLFIVLIFVSAIILDNYFK
jgi:hypothetical protein